MKEFANIQKICLCGWLLAALLIGGINIHQFMMVENHLPARGSQTIKSLQANLQQFEQTLADGLFSLASQIQLPTPEARLQPTGAAAKGTPVSGDPKALQIPTSEPVVLPSLTGIMHVVGKDGSIYFQALLNGRIRRAKEKIDGFTVVGISRKAVEVRKSGMKWTIECETPYYSSDQGN